MNSEYTRLGVGLVVSITLNTLLIVPGLTSDADADGLAGDQEQAVQPPDFGPPPDEVKLGIQESEASTLTWIGYEEYRDHMARLSELDQAFFVAGGAASGGGGTPAPANRPAPASTPTEQRQPQPAPTPLPKQPPLPEMPDETLPKAAPTDHEATADTPPQDTSTQPTPEAAPPTPSAAPPAPTGGDNAPIPGPPKPQVGPSATGADDLPPVPNASNRDADAAAIVPVNVKKPGGPVAAQGLEVRTFRPILTAYEASRFGRISIVVKIAFDRRGKPRRVFIGTPDPKRKTMRWKPATNESGYTDKVITSLYRWRASGKQLKELEGDETIEIVFELTFK